MSEIYKSKSVEDTLSIAQEFAASLKVGDIVRLEGELGAGKTHFVKGVASYFNVDMDKVNSPTFTLINEYPGEVPIYHFDCYRLKDEQEALEIGAEEYFFGDGVSLIEWPDKIENLIPADVRKVRIKNLNNNLREIVID